MTMRIHGDKIEFPDGTEQFTASSGSGGEAQPPVAFRVQLKDDLEIPSETNTNIPLETVELDTDNAWNGTHYLVPKDGIYSLQASTYISDTEYLVPLHHLGLMIFKTDAENNEEIISRYYNKIGTGSDLTKEHGPRSGSTPVAVTAEFKAGDKIDIRAYAMTHSGSNFKLMNSGLGRTYFSGHMVSSFTEGEVKEKGVVAFHLKGSSDALIEYPDVSVNYLNLSGYITNVDTDSGIDKDKDAYVVPEDGFYQFDTGVTYQDSTGVGTAIRVFRDGETHYFAPYQYFQSFDYPFNSYTSVNSATVDCKKGDEVKVEFWGKKKAANSGYLIRPTRTWFSGHLITGQSTGGGSGGGDSIWTEEDGKAVYDNDIKVNSVTVGTGGGKNNTNVSVGRQALEFNTTGNGNSAIGSTALQKNIEGSENTAVGRSSLVNTTGNRNTAIGRTSGSTLTTGTNNTCIGYSAQPSAPTVSNEVTIGNDAVANTRLKGKVTTNNSLVVNGTSPVGTASAHGTSSIRFTAVTTGFSTAGQSSGFGVYRKASGRKPGYTWTIDNHTASGGTDDTDYQIDNMYFNFRETTKDDTLTTKMKISPSGRVDITGSLYVNGTPKSLDVMVTDLEKDGKLKDKLIEKLSARLDELEKRIK